MKHILFSQQIDSILMKDIVPVSDINSIWFWLSIIEFIVIAYFSYKLLRKKKNIMFLDLTNDNLKESRNADIDMNSIMDSINQSRDLYVKLCSLCHPDRFVNTSKEKIAEEIFQEISRNKRNFKELSLLKTRATIELDVEM